MGFKPGLPIKIGFLVLKPDLGFQTKVTVSSRVNPGAGGFEVLNSWPVKTNFTSLDILKLFNSQIYEREASVFGKVCHQINPKVESNDKLDSYNTHIITLRRQLIKPGP